MKRGRMRPGRLWQWPKLIGGALRGWCAFFFIVILASAGINLIFSSDPGQNLSFLERLAQAYPVFFWPGLSLLTIPALLGMGLLVSDLWRKLTRQRAAIDIYLEHMVKEYQTIPCVLDPDRPDDFPESVFQALELKIDDSRHMADDVGARRVNGGELFKVLQTYATRTIVILGDPGSGKTTMLRHWVVERARQVDQPGGYLPIYISLRDFAPELEREQNQPASEEEDARFYGARLVAYLEKHDAQHVPSFARDLRELLMRLGRVFLFLDGLDEVDPRLLDEVKQWIETLQLDQQGALIIGTRYTGYRSDPLRSLEPKEWIVQDMREEDRHTLAIKLLRALNKQADAPLTFASEAEETAHFEAEADALVKRLKTHDRFEEWSGNPLLFTLAVLVYVRHQRQLPVSRVDMYARSVDALLHKTVKEEWKHRHDTEYLPLLDQIRTVLSEVARRLYEMPLFTQQDLIGPLAQIGVEMGFGMDLGARLAGWVLRSRLVRPLRGGEVFEFIHKTFREYLATAAMARRLARGTTTVQATTWKQIDDVWFTDAWTQPMRMLAGALVSTPDIDQRTGQKIAREWLDRLLRMADDPANRHREEAIVLAVASLSEIPDLEAISQQIAIEPILVAWAEALLRTARAEEQDRLGDLQRLRKRLPRTAVKPATDRLTQALGDGTQPAVQVAAALALEGLGDAVEAAPLARLLEAAGDERARLQAALTLARLEYADGTHPGHAILLAGLQSEDAMRRRIIAEALRTAGPSGQDLLLTALSNADPLVRRAVVLAIADSQDPAMEAAVRQALNDPDAEVAGAALLALTRGTLSFTAETSAEHVAGLLRDLREPERSAVATRLLGEWERGGRREDALRLAQTLGEDAAWPIWQARARLEERYMARLDAIGAMARQHGPENALMEAAHAVVPFSLQRLQFQGAWQRGATVIVPPTVEVPAGPFWMGSDKSVDKQAYDDEYRQQITLAAFSIGVYPVTVAEYACAVKAGVMREPPESGGINWEKQLTRLDHPVVCVSWQDAMAYCTWLRQVTGQPWHLPTEAEWEKAARGTDGRIYPWGNGWEKALANTNDGGPGGTTPVGQYAQAGDASPYGCHDMAGNVLEWTSSIWRGDAYSNDNNHENNQDTTSSRVLRGGSWDDGPQNARAAYRLGLPGVLNYNWGFRVGRAGRAG